ncbi:AAA family ATPase [Novipirellula sp. SH528]|uniref:AAA family ATPase n=1 Tax=Novipirellula sp. SH528 TaxID=3454466 RepID=UPI003F9F2590
MDGKRVLVDANFRDDASRRLILDAATKLGVRVAVLICHADPDIIRTRFANRSVRASRADWWVHLKAAENRDGEPPCCISFRETRELT